MILDYFHSKNKKQLSISYIDDSGNKKILNFNVNKFKTYYYTPSGQYTSWDGAKCDIKYVENPSKFDIKTFFEELEPKYKNLLEGKVTPKLYTFDIETAISDEFPEPSLAKQEITAISVASPDCNVIVMGTKPLDKDGQEYLSKSFDNYVENTNFFHTLKLKKPYIKYLYFDTEKQMIEYFLKNIVSKVSMIAGWNSILFDWQYIVNRIRNYYPDLSIQLSSCSYQTQNKQYTDNLNNKINLPMPVHTLVLDMMDIIKTFDVAKILEFPESYRLDYVAKETIGVNKIEYEGTLQDLYETDYAKYIYYNAIDSFLVQLIDKRFRIINNICIQSLYCTEKIGSCFSKIALTEALVFKDFYKNDLKIVYQDNQVVERGRLLGAYVKKPLPGKYEFIACNDFASLYPSTICTCNLSFENYCTYAWNETELNKYRNSTAYIVIGPNVFKNDGTIAKPEIGDFVGKFLDDEKLEKYRKDPNYFVSVNGCIYNNDKDYAFRRIQTKLKADRNVSKYLSKELDAKVMLDIEHIKKGQTPNNTNYSEQIINDLKHLGYSIVCTEDLYKVDLETFERELRNEITYHTLNEQAMKLLGNSMYGGSSHVSFYWFNMNLANDITGESRNLTLMMEDHLDNYFKDNWGSMTEWHKKWNISLKEDWYKYLNNNHLVKYSDTDSLYIEYNSLLRTIDGFEKMSYKEKLDILLKINLEFLNQHNFDYIKEYYDKRFAKSVHNFELETVAKSGVWLDVKKKYAQILLWKDGKFFDEDNLPVKAKGLEVIKSAVPKIARKSLKELIVMLLESPNEYLIQKLNIKMQEEKVKFYNANLEDICGSINVSNYKKYIADDTGEVLKVELKCPSSVRSLGNYNQIRNYNNLPGEPIYGGKVKWYKYKVPGSYNKTDFFAFQSMNYPEWANKYAPICRRSMFQQFVVDPFNRIITSIGLPKLEVDGNIQNSLF